MARSTASRALACAALFSALGAAQAPSEGFAPPVRLKAGDKWLGEKRLYPSPVFHDVNGDGHLDIVVGDLPGKLTVALRKPGTAMAFEAEKDLPAASGKALKFNNW